MRVAHPFCAIGHSGGNLTFFFVPVCGLILRIIHFIPVISLIFNEFFVLVAAGELYGLIDLFF